MIISSLIVLFIIKITILQFSYLLLTPVRWRSWSGFLKIKNCSKIWWFFNKNFFEGGFQKKFMVENFIQKKLAFCTMTMAQEARSWGCQKDVHTNSSFKPSQGLGSIFVPTLLQSILDFGAKMGTVIVTVLDDPGPPNFAGTLVRSIPTQINRFWEILGILKKLFIFVHSVQSGNLGPHFGLPNVSSSSHCTYQT